MISEMINDSQLSRMIEKFELPITIFQTPHYSIELPDGIASSKLKPECAYLRYCNKAFCDVLELKKSKIVGLPFGAIENHKVRNKLGFAHVFSIRLPKYGEPEICFLVVWSCSTAYSVQRLTEHLLSCALQSVAKNWFAVIRPDSFSKGGRTEEIIRLTKMGFTSKEIGYFLKISANTVAQIKWRVAKRYGSE